MKKIILSLMLFTWGIHAEEIYATFNVEADKSANLAFTSSGIIDHVSIDVATIVKSGDVLAELQNEDLKAALAIAKASFKFAKKEYERQLKVKHLVDESQLDSYVFKYENAKAQLDYQQALLDKTILKAPFDGVIYEKSVEVGDAVSGAMLRTILKIESLHERKLVLEFDQKYWKDIEVGQEFNYKIDGDPTLHKGTISKIYPSANMENRKIKAEVETKDLVVGLFGEGYISTPDAE